MEAQTFHTHNQNNIGVKFFNREATSLCVKFLAFLNARKIIPLCMIMVDPFIKGNQICKVYSKSNSYSPTFILERQLFVERK